MTVVDAQIHVWAAESPERPWLPAGKSFAHRSAFSAEDAIAAMDAAGVDMAVLVPPSWEGNRNDVCVQATVDHPERFITLGRIPLTDEAQGRHLIHAWREQGLSGVRLTFSRGSSAGMLTDGSCDWLWPLLADAGIATFVYAPGQLGVIRALALEFSTLRLTIDHLGLASSSTNRDVPAAVESLLTLSDLETVSVKATCVPAVASDPYPYRSTREQVRRVIDAFGADRVFWGSDLTRLPCEYDACLRLFTDELGLRDADIRSVAGEEILRWLGAH